MKQLCNAILIASLLGCTSPNENAEQLSANWEQHYNQCVDLETASQDEFATNQWFNELPLDEKKSVALYVYQSNFYECHKGETEAFKSKLVSLKAEEQYYYYKGIGAFDLPDASLISNVDKAKVDQLIKLQPESLNLRNLGYQLGFVQ
ncbi:MULTISPECIES: hypothetical protein [Vibrio]|uniref:Uncharacterized protein n=1 Tax=Vibrio coralliilyticus TaxID=190893 RepID=A0AAP6ZQT5_9VIBR|nr:MULTISPECIES: hypothetical protein [Vibrio]NOJ22184.1 hypothetical protein [Vibrio coralliilyticus]PAU38375.1 hypothetical protein CKF94_08780 [Vibrio coralliilyticus]QFT35962.1 hypothetical protein FIU99_05935 [Vibrio sp. THAF64]QGM33862.1 hypothetical protein GGC04_05945 [Vibrio sp. THAF191d]QGN69364.1 hypothetical protein GGC03_05950 [Vibrio sp. THAF191c]